MAIYGTVSAGNDLGMKNRIINGAMSIDQRYVGGAISAATLGSGGYTLDRWKFQGSQSAKFSAQQNAGSVAVQASTGFANYLGFTSASNYSIASTDYFRVMQPIEGLNGADLAWGTASAKTITISFWVYASLIGTYGVALQNNDNNRGYTGSYTINAQNTWEYKTVTIAGDTSGTWKTDNNIFAQVAFYFGAGSTQQTTPGSWSSTINQSATGQINVSGTSGATFYITGVQLEKGSTATSFDYRPYGTELQLCQRYYYKTIADSAYGHVGMAILSSSTAGTATFPFPVSMRVVASSLDWSGVAACQYASSPAIAWTSASLSGQGTKNLGNASFSTGSSAGGTGLSVQIIANNNSAAYVGFNAEL